MVKSHRSPGPRVQLGLRCLPVTKWVEEVLTGLQLGASGGVRSSGQSQRRR